MADLAKLSLSYRSTLTSAARLRDDGLDNEADVLELSLTGLREVAERFGGLDEDGYPKFAGPSGLYQPGTVENDDDEDLDVDM